MKKNYSNTTKLNKNSKIKNGSLDLIIKITDTDFQYVIIDKIKILEIKNIKLKSFNTIDQKINLIKEIIDDNSVLKNKKWKSTKISILSSKFTLIPKPFFRRKDCDLYLKYVSSYQDKKEKIIFHKHNKLGFYNVFSLDKKIYKFFNKFFNKNNIFHEGSALIEGFYKTIINNKKSFFIYFDDDIIHILLFENKLLVYYNIFLIKEDSYLKYIFLIIKEMKLSQEKMKIIISGNNLKVHLDKLKRYFSKIEILSYNDFKLKINENNFISLLFNNNL
mgnify:CR=1 FL=1